MAQKILAGRSNDPSLAGELVQVKVDQVVLARAPGRVLAEAAQAGLAGRKTLVETAIAYDGCCVTTGPDRAPFDGELASQLLARGVLVARAGAGFPSVVHVERFAAPARLCVTDEPRLAGAGGAGMLTFVVSSGQLAQALAQGTVWLRPPRTVQVLLTGRVRPFVCARDVALELVRRGLGEAVRRVEEQHRGPVVLEIAGPGVRLLSVGERAVLASLAPQVGAAAVLFVSDERTEVYLRDQRRSKAYRALAADAGAPCDEVLHLDLAGVDPLVMDERGEVRSVRDLAGKAVAQVLLGGDSGVTLRDLFAVAALLKSKRVPARLDVLLAIPSRQMLEVLAQSGALADLIAMGARLVEPDARVMAGSLYPPPPASEGLAARTCDPEPGRAAPFVVASAETLAYAVATGEMGDPRSFKRPARITVPRELPTDDVLVVRERREGSKRAAAAASASGGTATGTPAPAPTPWRSAQTLEVIDAPALLANGRGHAAIAVLCATLDEVRSVAARAESTPAIRAVVAAFIPSAVVAQLSGAGVAAIEADAASIKSLRERAQREGTIALPAPSAWSEREPTAVASGAGGAKIPLTWLALGLERAWASAGTSVPSVAAVSRQPSAISQSKGRRG